MKFLIDTNVLLDTILQREPFCKDSDKVVEMICEGKAEGCVSVQSLKDVFFFCKKNADIDKSFKTIERLSYIFEIIDVNNQDVFSALMYDISDFESGLLGFSAKRNNVDGIITRNGKGFVDLDMAIIDPKDIEQYIGTGVNAGDAISDELYDHVLDVKYGKRSE
jgi:predicted nucleic acid-binding protein